MRSLVLMVFGVMVTAQWLLPLKMVHDNERVLREGIPFNFRTSPIDPHDPFRGEFVVLHFALEDEKINVPIDDKWEYGQPAYIVLKTVNGEARIEQLLKEHPNGNEPYVKCTVDIWQDGDSMHVQVDLPFDRYYLEEGTGRRTENLLTESNSDQEHTMPAYVIVRILDGEAAIEELMIADRPLREWLQEK